MTSRDFRVKVRGEFKHLTPEQREKLLAESGETDEDLSAATERAEAAARGWLDGRGLSYVLRSVQAEDMSKAPLSKRQRRQQHG